MEMIGQYLLFLAKIATAVIAVFILLSGIFAIVNRNLPQKGNLTVNKLNEKYNDVKDILENEILSKPIYKKLLKDRKLLKKQEHKNATEKKNVYVLHFEGDIRASAVNSLREEISAILMVAKPEDEVLLCLESAGGTLHGYGLAASQLVRLREKDIRLVVAVDKVAASGGYMMASVANWIIAAPFAIIGSVGVVGQIPNFNRLLKKNEIDFELHTAGEYKRTLTLFGENTDNARAKFKDELEDAFILFKNFIKQVRSKLNIDQIATGEHWYGTRALELQLVDQLLTSDDYLLNSVKTANVYRVCYKVKPTLLEKIKTSAMGANLGGMLAISDKVKRWL